MADYRNINLENNLPLEIIRKSKDVISGFGFFGSRGCHQKKQMFEIRLTVNSKRVQENINYHLRTMTFTIPRSVCICLLIVSVSGSSPSSSFFRRNPSFGLGRGYVPIMFQPKQSFRRKRLNHQYGIFISFDLVKSGGNQDKNVVVDDDYERAEKAILMSIARVENLVEKAVANEVDILFHKDHPQKEQLVSKAKMAVTEAVGKVKRSVEDHSTRNTYPFEKKPDSGVERHDIVHKDHRILRAVESAEQALIHAIASEVDTLFHETEHHPKLKGSIQKASNVVEKVHDHRRDWLQNVATNMIEEYSIPDFFLE